MKRLLICLVALIAVFALVMPASAAEMKVSGLWNAKAYARNNFDGDDDNDDATQFVTQRFRSYWNWIASENLKLVYKNEIDFEWGDLGSAAGRNSGGGAGGDAVNLETKNVYLEFMVPDTPVKATLGLQGVALHKGWLVDDDLAGSRFDMNFDPVSITAYWMGLAGLEADDQTSSGVVSNDASDDWWQLVVSGAYKAENMDARLSLAYERRPNDVTSADAPESDDLYMLMGEFGMTFDMISFNILGATNFGERDSDGADDRDYEGFLFKGDIAFALDMATIRLMGLYASGDDEGDFDEDFQGLRGQTAVTAEIISDGYSYDRNANLEQIGGANNPSNMYMVNVGVDLKPTDTTTLKFDVYYIGMVEDRTIAGDDEDEIGIEVDARLTQKIYDNLSLTVLGCYLFAEDGYGFYRGAAGQPAASAADGSGDDAFQVGLGLDFKF
ncbi:MAG: hypothetical protein PVI74_16555 [Syntrophobacterales bacterium]|jgi:hypothetical protein